MVGQDRIRNQADKAVFHSTQQIVHITFPLQERNQFTFEWRNDIMNEIKEESRIRKKISRLYGDMSARRKRFLNYLLVVIVTFVLIKGFQFIKEQVSREMYQLCILLFFAVWGLGFIVISKRKKGK